MSNIFELDGRVVEALGGDGNATSKPCRGAMFTASVSPLSSSARIILCVLTESLSFAETLASPERFPDRGSDRRDEMLCLFWGVAQGAIGMRLDLMLFALTGELGAFWFPVADWGALLCDFEV